MPRVESEASGSPSRGAVSEPAEPVEAASAERSRICRGARGWARTGRVLTLAAADAAALSAAGALAYLAWAQPVRGQSPALYLDLWPLLGLFLLGYAQAGLYPGFGLGPVETLRRLSLVTAAGFAVVASISFVFKLPALYSRMTFVLGFALALLAVPFGRALLRPLLRRVGWWLEPVVLIPLGSRAGATLEVLRRIPDLGYRVLGLLDAGDSAERGAGQEVATTLGTLERASALAASGVQTALVEAGELPRPGLVDRLQQHFHRVVVLGALADLPVEGVQVRNLGGLLGLEYTNNLLRARNRIVKRSLDLVLAASVSLVAAPLVAVAGLAVLALDGRPVFFTQERLGLGGRRILVRKIRTMRRDAESRLEEHLARDPQARREWEERFKLRRDPRLVPGIGALLRRFSLDELPQLWSVLAGEMSLVGPRPFPEYHLSHFPPEFRELRARVRPGMSGMWQVMARSEGGVTEQQAFDSYYIRNWSVWLDLYLLARTVGVVVSGRGAY